MTTVAVVIGRRSEKEFARVISELKTQGFTYNPIKKEWSKTVPEDKAQWWVHQLAQTGLRCYFVEDQDGGKGKKTFGKRSNYGRGYGPPVR